MENGPKGNLITCFLVSSSAKLFFPDVQYSAFGLTCFLEPLMVSVLYFWQLSRDLLLLLQTSSPMFFSLAPRVENPTHTQFNLLRLASSREYDKKQGRGGGQFKVAHLN